MRVTNAIQYETEKDTNITYKELFEKLEADIAKIDERLLEVQTLSSLDTKSVTDPTVMYLKTSQEYLRALLSTYRKQLALQSARTLTEKVNEEEYKESLRKLLATVDRLRKARERVKPLFSDDALIPATQLDSVVQKNTSTNDSAQKNYDTPDNILELEPFIVNLSDSGAKRYMKLKIEIEFDSKDLAVKAKQLTPKLRDQITIKLTKLSVRDIMTPESKIKLKGELIEKINEILKPSNITDLYFTELVVQ